MSRPVKIVVADGRYVHSALGSHPWPLNMGHFAAVIAQMMQNHVSQLWIHPAAGDWPEPAEYAQAEACGYDLGKDPKKSHWLHIFKRGANETLDIVFPSRDRAHPAWSSAPTGKELYEDIWAYNDALGTMFHRSAGATGQRLMRELHSGRNATRLDMPQGAPPPALGSKADRAMNWSKRLTHDDLIGKMLIAFDINGQYLAACSSLPLGVGAYRHMTGTECYALERHAPGYWRVLAPQAADSSPIPLLDGQRVLDSNCVTGWITTPTLNLLFEMGAHVFIDEAYVWPEHVQYLQPWYRKMREARRILKARGGAAYDAFKDTYTVGLASLAGNWKRKEPDELFRPDWRDAIIGQSRANQYRGLHRIRMECGASPVAIGADCSFFLAPSPEWTPAGMKIDDNLGHDKRVGTAIAAQHPAIERVLTSGLSGPYRVRLLQQTVKAIHHNIDPDAIWQNHMRAHIERAEVEAGRP